MDQDFPCVTPDKTRAHSRVLPTRCFQQQRKESIQLSLSLK